MKDNGGATVALMTNWFDINLREQDADFSMRLMDRKNADACQMRSAADGHGIKMINNNFKNYK